MIDGVIVKALGPIRDDRGELCEILRSDDELFERFGQVYYTTVKPGVVKAWHYHKVQTDHLFTIGPPALIALADGRDGSPTKGEVMELTAGREAPVLIRIPPGIYHGFTAAGDREAVILNVPTEPYDRDEPDEFRLDPFENDIPFDWRAKGATRGH
ncbi:MAG: polysaccharide biosynthesis C-terminal domain-containing protein [Planctomycetota bacterium]|jgi:dTDP-4-dehydrorhamnose 3,5-epimerase